MPHGGRLLARRNQPGHPLGYLLALDRVQRVAAEHGVNPECLAVALSCARRCQGGLVPQPPEIGRGISGGSMGNPDSPAESSDAADASCTGA